MLFRFRRSPRRATRGRTFEWGADFDLSGRAAIVTGGIGLGMAKALARAGCALSIWARNPEKNRAAPAKLVPCGARVEARTCDVTDRAAVEDAFAGTLEAFGRVDGYFANAGIGATGRRAFVDRAEDDWRRMFATNLDGDFYVFRAALRHMIKRAESGDRSGRLVATSSLASLYAMPRRALRGDQGGAECANPRARGRACLLRRHRQRDPARLDRDRDDRAPHGQRKVRPNVMPRIPMRRFAEPDDFGGIAVYLMSVASASCGRALELRAAARPPRLLTGGRRRCQVRRKWRLRRRGRPAAIGHCRTS